MNRKEFLKKTAAIGGVVGLSSLFDGVGYKLSADENILNDNTDIPDLVAVRNGEPDVMFDAGIKAIGGIERFVKKGQTVLVKPNIGWNVSPEGAANTNPGLVKRIIESCLNAGAKKVYVFDHTCDNPAGCYKNSGIENVVKNVGGEMVDGSAFKYYHEFEIPTAKVNKKNRVHELVLDTDVFINVPILKSHSGSGSTIAMKNLMGVVWDRGVYHSTDLHRSIAEFCLYKKPTLNIVDAYVVMTKYGPRGISSGDGLKLIKNLLISTDIVAVDSAASLILNKEPSKTNYIKIADELKIGVMDLNKVKIKKISV